MELLERAPFLQTLADYAAEARSGNGRLVLVSGESGIGPGGPVLEHQPADRPVQPRLSMAAVVIRVPWANGG